MKGFTLVELLVVIAIASILSLVSYESIVMFQQQTVVESTANDFISLLKTAQAKSRDGEIETGKTYDVNGLPTYKVELNATSFSLIRHDVLSDMTVENDTLETHTFDTHVTFTPTTYTVTFQRISGLPDNAATIQVQRGSSTTAKNIKISDNGIIAYE